MMPDFKIETSKRFDVNSLLYWYNKPRAAVWIYSCDMLNYIKLDITN